MNARHLYSKYTISICIHLACSAGVFFEREICSQKRHVETSQREEVFFSSPPPPFPPFALAPTVRVTISTLHLKSKMAATTILPKRTRFRPPKIRLHCRLKKNKLELNIVFVLTESKCNSPLLMKLQFKLQFIQGHPTTIFGKYLFGRRFQI